MPGVRVTRANVAIIRSLSPFSNKDNCCPSLLVMRFLNLPAMLGLGLVFALNISEIVPPQSTM